MSARVSFQRAMVVGCKGLDLISELSCYSELAKSGIPGAKLGRYTSQRYSIFSQDIAILVSLVKAHSALHNGCCEGFTQRNGGNIAVLNR